MILALFVLGDSRQASAEVTGQVDSVTKEVRLVASAAAEAGLVAAALAALVIFVKMGCRTGALTVENRVVLAWGLGRMDVKWCNISWSRLSQSWRHCWDIKTKDSQNRRKRPAPESCNMVTFSNFPLRLRQTSCM